MLSISISDYKLNQLLNTPVGNTMRGISDALDCLHIKNEVYQLPTEYLRDIPIPFIVGLHSRKSPFCIVNGIGEKDIYIQLNHLKSLKLPLSVFFRQWTGTVLTARVNAQTIHEKHCTLKNILYNLYINRLYILLGCLVFISYFANNVSINSFYSHLTFLWGCILLSVFIIHKDSYNNEFLKQFCRIGTKIDCNQVSSSLISKWIKPFNLGEIALVFFISLIIPLMLGYENVVLECMLQGLAFLCAILSICYQVFILRKYCLFCIVLDVLIIVVFYIVLSRLFSEKPEMMTVNDILRWVLTFLVLSLGWSFIHQLFDYRDKSLRLQEKYNILFQPQIFEGLLHSGNKMEIPSNEITLEYRSTNGKKNLIMITNIRCKKCIYSYQELRRLSSIASIKIIFTTFGKNDFLGKEYSEKLISIYFSQGKDKFLSVLELWFKQRDPGLFKSVMTTDYGKAIFKKQQEYCRKIMLDHTPEIIMDRYIVPEIYDIKDLFYLI